MNLVNLTNSPYNIALASGESVMLPARGRLDNVELDSFYLQQIKLCGYIEIEQSDPAKEPEQKPDAIETLRSEYEELSGKQADGRWSAKKLRNEIDTLLES